jgi:ribonuclease BN (tRNA processing enzyme)
MKLVPLGTNGFFPTLGRQTQCYLVLTDDAAILLDAGTGVGRLLEPEIAKLIDGYERLDVFLSHYHLDHCGGLAYLSEVWRGSEVVIHGPAPPFAKATPNEALNRLLNAPFSPPLEAYPFKVELVPVNTTAISVNGFEMSFRGQRHWRDSMGIRIGDDITYVTDTVVDDGTIDLARDVKLLMHEVWMTDAELETDEVGALNHSHVSGVARIAREANVGRLMVTHHHPKRTAAEVVSLARDVEKLAEREVIVPEESRVYEV